MNIGFWMFLGAIALIVIAQVVSIESLGGQTQESAGIGSGIIFFYGLAGIVVCLIGMGISALVHYG